jgi:hypothetical protein
VTGVQRHKKTKKEAQVKEDSKLGASVRYGGWGQCQHTSYPINR